MKVFSATDIGQKRTMNQDFVFASASPVGNLPNLFVVADGMEAITRAILLRVTVFLYWWNL